MPAGGWGSLKEVTTILLKERIPVEGPQLLAHQNKPDGDMCVSCAWAKPAHPHPAEFCESGAKATAWEVTGKRVDPAFFQRHTVRELEGWNDHELEELGRLTVPMRYDGALDRYVETTWEPDSSNMCHESTSVALPRSFRGVHDRKVLFMAGADMARLGLADGDIVTASTAVDRRNRSPSGWSARVVRVGNCTDPDASLSGLVGTRT